MDYKKGEKIEGEVVKFNPFGVFVRIAPKIQALCHVSEFKNEKEMKGLLKIGEKYNFEISLIDPEEHKMILKFTDSDKQKEIKDANSKDEDKNSVPKNS